MIGIQTILKIIVLIGTGLVAGSTFYISLVEIKVRTQTNEEEHLKNWQMVFPKASRILKTFGIITVIFILLAWYFTQDILWIISAIPLFLLVPFTAIFISKTNAELANLKDVRGTIPKIHKWDKLHHVRTVLTILSFVIAVIASTI
ncbi:DUF1772 domain-containing protein [Aquimarina sp. D1M17]|uniref:DUF1772 domain-containing protein n=1 Tax=Aquimarina acroporae TaxID=2937283 RepID=UPI0020BF3E74|nr:DUF1772 domain-containing protein [Aquimarina acroporae]MCK8521808.1 DUF1772 domain-containing protein [Aquimarina acroporae]